MGNKILFYGYGNPGRQDDGLGIEIAGMIESDGIDGVDIDTNYQLNIEDALTISGYDTVIFADASIDAPEPYSFSSIDPVNEIAFTTHAMSAKSVLSLCGEIYNRVPDVYMLAIRGYEWELIESLSPEAKKNCSEAYVFIRKFIDEKISQSAISNNTGEKCDGRQKANTCN
jgi:hydrogenase maturation protease